MVARRELLVAGAAGGVALFLPRLAARAAAPSPPVLSAEKIPKYRAEVLRPGVMPPLQTLGRGGGVEYRIAVRQLRQQVLPSGFPATTLWGYGSPGRPETFGSPSPSIEARVGEPVTVTWLNELVDREGRFLPHLFAVDPTLHWANPGGGKHGRDGHSSPQGKVSPYGGPVPLVTHLHGAHVHDDSDGYPEAWYLPSAKNIPGGYASVGSWYDPFREQYADRRAQRWSAGSATFHYPNEQSAGTLWFHDHALGITRLNMYAGPVGFYLLRGGADDLPSGVLPDGRYELPLVIQDRTFRPDGSLSYPSEPSRPGFTGPYAPQSDVPPVWNPMFFGNTMLVNGRTWPVMPVEPRRYRLRLLNGCNARGLMLSVVTDPTARPASPVVPFWQVGADGGFLPRPVQLERIRLGNGERADVVVDFSGIPEGTELYLINEAPEVHLDGGGPPRYLAADPDSTGQVMKFVVGSRDGTDTSVPPEELGELPVRPPLGEASLTRRLSLSLRSSSLANAGPVAHLLGTVGPDGRPVPRHWTDPSGVNPLLGTTEIWELHNLTRETHPIHVHQGQFEVLGRGPDGRRPPEAGERGVKDVVMAPPGEVTRIKLRFELPGRYVWHCHILEHEDNEMMLPFVVGRNPSGPVPAGAGPRDDRHPVLAGIGTGLVATAAVGAVLAARRATNTRRPER